MDCVQQTGHITDAIDCDDGDPWSHPGAEEIIGDGVDQDCDGTEICFVDADLDGDADATGLTVASADPDCDDPGEGSADQMGDCDDTDPSISALASESAVLDGIDNDCDGYIDEGGLLGAGDVVITEVFLSDDEDFEWFELFNSSGVDITIGAGWVIENAEGESDELDHIPYVFEAGEHIWVHNDASGAHYSSQVVYKRVDLGSPPDGSALTLRFDDPEAGSIVLDQVDYSQPGFPTASLPEEYSLQLNNSSTSASAPSYAADNADGRNWCGADTATHITAGTPISAYTYNWDGWSGFDDFFGGYGTPGKYNGSCDR